MQAFVSLISSVVNDEADSVFVCVRACVRACASVHLYCSVVCDDAQRYVRLYMQISLFFLLPSLFLPPSLSPGFPHMVLDIKPDPQNLEPTTAELDSVEALFRIPLIPVQNSANVASTKHSDGASLPPEVDYERRQQKHPG